MFQFIDTLDCNSAGSAYLVNLYGGMRVVVQNQFGGAFTDWAIMRMPSLG